MAVLLEDREAARPLLLRDPLRNATVIHRMFHHPDFTLAFADKLPEPTAVLALSPARTSESPHQFALHATDPRAAASVVRAVPPGFSIFHLADDLAFEPVRRRLKIGWWGEAIYYALDRDDFRDVQEHDVGPLDPTNAEKVAKIWAPEWPATNYVRSRLENGVSGAIYIEGEPVAWYLTHHETDAVVVLGFLHVLEGHRRKGYARSLSCGLIKQVFAKGKIPACHVYTDNTPSILLMESLGFHRVCVQAWGDGVSPG